MKFTKALTLSLLVSVLIQNVNAAGTELGAKTPQALLDTVISQGDTARCEDLVCMINAAKKCKAAVLDGNQPIDWFGVVMNVTVHKEIKGKDASGKCVIYESTETSVTSLPASVTDKMTDDEKAEYMGMLKGSAGKIEVACRYDAEKVVELFSKAKEGVLVDHDLQDCVTVAPAENDDNVKVEVTYDVSSGETRRELIVPRDGDSESVEFSVIEFLMRAGYGDVAAVMAFLDAGMNVNARHSIDYEAVSKAEEKGDYEEAERLRNGSDVKGYTALILAARNGNAELIRLLLERGADVNAKALTDTNSEEAGWTALLEAAFKGNMEVAELLLSRGADKNAQYEKCGTSLIFGVKSTNIEMVKLLLLKEADVNAKDWCGQTALMYAADAGNKKMVKTLLANGADVNAKSDNGQTALDIAKKKKYADVVKLLKNKRNK